MVHSYGIRYDMELQRIGLFFKNKDGDWCIRMLFDTIC